MDSDIARYTQDPLTQEIWDLLAQVPSEFAQNSPKALDTHIVAVQDPLSLEGLYTWNPRGVAY